MKIDLKYLLPVIVPVVTVLVLRACALIAGVEYTQDAALVVLAVSILVGVLAGPAALLFMIDFDHSWTVTLRWPRRGKRHPIQEYKELPRHSHPAVKFISEHWNPARGVCLSDARELWEQEKYRYADEIAEWEEKYGTPKD